MIEKTTTINNDDLAMLIKIVVSNEVRVNSILASDVVRIILEKWDTLSNEDVTIITDYILINIGSMNSNNKNEWVKILYRSGIIDN